MAHDGWATPSSTPRRYTLASPMTIRAVTSPLDRLAPLIEERPRPEV